MKMINYITRPYIETIISTMLYNTFQDADSEVSNVVNRFYYLMQHATERIHLYDALNESLVYCNISVETSEFNLCAKNLLDILPSPEKRWTTPYREVWHIKSDQNITEKAPDKKMSLEDRVAQLERTVKDIQLELSPNYCGRM